jgi:ribonuclease Z
MNRGKLLRTAGAGLITAFILMAVYRLGVENGRTGGELSAVGAVMAQPAAKTNKPAPPSPIRARPRDVYFPNSEDLAADEMRIISLGTGMPSSRRSQGASAWLVELGNGDKFLFDIGSGSAGNLGSLEIPYEYLNKVFISHLHTDHMGDLTHLYVGGVLAGRVGPLYIWGPSGSEKRLGTRYAAEHLKEYLAWDIAGRAGRLPASAFELVVSEFDYKGENQVVYKENGVTIRSWPAIHVLDGSVSYSLEWNGLKFVFGGDTYPNRWFVKYAKGADLAIHECMMAVETWIEKYRFPVGRALEVATQIHTTPESFGKVMSEVKPRMAVAYHFFTDFDVVPLIGQGIMKTYDGPFTLADDLMVWNVTKDAIRVRTVKPIDEAWPPPPAKAPPPIDQALMKVVSKEIGAGALDVKDVDQTIYDRINKQYGTGFKQRER